jgi:outer membrane receptor protein involved in Fe transport
MRRIPPLNGKIGLYYTNRTGFWGRLEYIAAGRQNRLANGDIDDSRIPDGGTPGWNILNLRGGYTWRKIEISAGINNTFNVDYRTHGSGVNGYGRSVWAMFKIGL